jgi:hypothetical protein
MDDLTKTLIEALQAIYNGSTVTGRWLERSEGYAGEEVGQDPAAPVMGFYDWSEPPPGYNAEGWDGEGDEPPGALIPAEWEAYNGEDQDGWIASVAEHARTALIAAGIDPDKEPEPPLGSMVGGAS